MRKISSVFAKTYAPLVGALVVCASFVAHAQATNPGAGIAVAGNEDNSKYKILRGTTITYGHNASAFSFAPAGDPFYNPTWYHRLGLLPQVNFGKYFFTRARLFLSQEFTHSDSTTYRNEVELSDTSFDFGTTGYKESKTGIRISGDIRFTLPTSKASQAQTRYLGIGPSLAVSKNFEVLSGLSLSYFARATGRFLGSTTRLNESPRILACSTPLECAELRSSGIRNSNFDLVHGASVNLGFTDKFSASTSFFWLHVWLPGTAPIPAQYMDSKQLQSQAGTDVAVRNLVNFNVSVSYQVTKPISLSLGAYTFGGQLGDNGQMVFPLFNRNTTLFLDAAFDVEAALNAIL